MAEKQSQRDRIKEITDGIEQGIKDMFNSDNFRQYLKTMSRFRVSSCELQGWMKYKLESRLPGEISITSDRQMTPPLWQKVKEN